MPQTILRDRAVLSLSGDDRYSLLQGLITANVDRLETQKNIFAALLAPQGKIQFDFFLHRENDALWIDIDKARAADFLKRMKMYKLRANADIVETDHHVVVAWRETSDETLSGHEDARHCALGYRYISQTAITETATQEAYHAHRVALGVPEAGKDFDYDDIFPHDAMMDALHGVDFKKGCYVGQEVVSRVQHRSTARKRFFILKSAQPLQRETPVLRDGKNIGITGLPYGAHCLALLRVDKLGDEATVHVDGKDVTWQTPDYFARFQQ